MSNSGCAIVILAAGLGKRMRSNLPKVLHEVGGQPLVFHTLDRVREAAPDAPVALIVGHGREQVESAVRGNARFKGMDIHFVVQTEQKGTGHAARCAMDSPFGDRCVRENRAVLVLPGDSPLYTREMIARLVEPMAKTSQLRLLTTELADPTGYGRVVRKGKSVARIVEHKDASAKERAIREVAMSVYTFKPDFLQKGLRGLKPNNAQGEYYLTDLVALAAKKARGVEVLEWVDSDDLRGINDPWELAEAGRILNTRYIRKWAREQGVKVLDPQSTWIDATVELAEGVVIHPGAILQGSTRVARGATIGPRVMLKNMVVGEEANIKTGTVGEDSEIGARAQVGPYAHLRPESVVGPEAKIGNFVELKKARVGQKTSIAHLSYVGDAEVGARVNIGCGFVTCNFDGRVIDGSRKHKTVIEDDAFIGSDCQTVAPVRVGKGAYVASGSTITENVEPESLAIARSRQVNKPGYAKKLKG